MDSLLRSRCSLREHFIAFVTVPIVLVQHGTALLGYTFRFSASQGACIPLPRVLGRCCERGIVTPRSQHRPFLAGKGRPPRIGNP